MPSSDSSTSASAHTWQFYLTPPAAWDAMLDACRAATTHIACEQYIFETDGVGERFAEVFIQKAQQGVQVQLLCDGIGSFTLVDSALTQRLTEAGVQVLFYNRLRLWKVHKLLGRFLRDHRKLLVVDGRAGFAGGVCIGSRMQTWRDTHVRIDGPLATDMLDSFKTMWHIAAKDSARHLPKKIPAESAFRILNNSPRFSHRHIYHALLRNIAAAKTRIYLGTAYFVPSIRLTRALRKAARRGVDVRIMIPASSDVSIVDIAARSYVKRFLHAGVKIYQYQNTMFHPKTAVIDDAFALVGSANLDNLSMLLNYETAILSSDPAFVAELVEQFMADIPHAILLTLRTWNQRSIFQKCQEWVVRPLHAIL